MADFAINNALGGSQQNISSTYKTILYVTAAASSPRRGKVYDILVGTNGTPADNYMEYDISRQTASGTASVITVNALDPADANFTSLAAANATGEGTITANSSVFYVGVNQRASYRWVAAPGSELVFPATANNGFAQRTRSGGYTSTVTSAMLVQEQ